MRTNVGSLFFLCCFLIGDSGVGADLLVPANNSLINYYGRFDFSIAGAAKFNWSGSTIEASFEGSSIGIGLQDGQADYDIELDGKYYSTIQTVSNTAKYTISGSLAGGVHTIRIIQRSENHWNAAQFNGFYLADGMKLQNPFQFRLDQLVYLRFHQLE